MCIADYGNATCLKPGDTKIDLKYNSHDLADDLFGTKKIFNLMASAPSEVKKVSFCPF